MTDSEENPVLFCQRISANPLIFYSAPNEHSRLGIAEFVSPLVAQTPAVFLIALWWSYDDDESVLNIVKAYRPWQLQYPLHSLVVLCNTAGQVQRFGKYGMQCMLANHNIFLDESVFKPLDSENRTFDAVYNAGLTPFKRHNLCTAVPSLALLYGRWHDAIDKTGRYPNEVKAMLPNALFVNEALRPGEYVQLLPVECAQWYNRARVGLCLSAKEGAMNTSMEYLMSGLPIVSTPSDGGRDLFFDDETCLIVEPTPQAVADGVRAMIARDLSPVFVRQKVLEKVRRHRQSFMALLRLIFAKLGAPYPGDDALWNSFFVNKMIRPIRRRQLRDLVFFG
ncbi:MAG: glycosyltransferase [Rhodospirillales bacterium]